MTILGFQNRRRIAFSFLNRIERFILDPQRYDQGLIRLGLAI